MQSITQTKATQALNYIIVSLLSISALSLTATAILNIIGHHALASLTIHGFLIGMITAAVTATYILIKKPK